MAMLIDHFPISVAPGSRSLDAAIDSPGTIIVRLARQTTATPTLWSAAVLVSFQVEWSEDDGITYRDLCGFASYGGIAHNPKDGTEAVETTQRCPFPDPTNHVRVTVSVSGGTLVSEVTIERI